ncbi:MAG: DUF2318 domain-containing protein [Nanoarchaeota archaeon]|nr:DUF2318 domain-containing protein [Nanoarchaeota archaeon]MBU1103784.1 DUF2318 domain-containing protein [Nanoarchaeota archaeon]
MKIKKSTLIWIAIIIIAGIFFFRGKITGNVVGGNSGTMEIPLADISENAEWYEYQSNGKTIRFFVVKAGDGSVKTAFDACDVCYESKKGYSQQGDVMVCNNCGNKYPISGLGTENEKGGGCWPGYLPSKIVGDKLIIKNSDIEKGAYRF